MSTRTWRLACGAIFVGLALLGGACRSSKPPKPPKTGPAFRYVIKLDDTLRDATFQVDVLPVNNTTPGEVLTNSVTDYFKPGSDARAVQAIKRFDLSATKSSEVIPLAVPECKPYRYPGFTHIAILADIPMAPPAAGRDPRRLLLPLDPAKWPRKWIGKKNEIQITASRLGLSANPGFNE